MVDFPLPDSPTRPIISFSFKLKEILFSALKPFEEKKVDCLL